MNVEYVANSIRLRAKERERIKNMKLTTGQCNLIIDYLESKEADKRSRNENFMTALRWIFVLLSTIFIVLVAMFIIGAY